jgi:hypothetical protein
MCLDCGCGKPNDDHGDSRHITLNQINQAAEASGVSPQEAVDNISKGFAEAQSGSEGSSNA